MTEIKKVTLVGLGSMGSFFAPRLGNTLGSDFRVLASGSRRERLEGRGVTINGVNYRFKVVAPDDADPADLVIIAVKSYDLDTVIREIKNQVGRDTIIMSVLNGIDSENRLAAVYGMQRILHSYMRVSIVMKDGVTNYDPDRGSVHFGDSAAPGSEKELAVAELFSRCGIPYKIDGDIIYGMWFKYMCNIGENMTCALLGIPFGGFRVSGYANDMRKSAMREVVAVANRLGVELGEKDIERQESTVMSLPAANKPSTLQDLENGRRTEADMFAGTVVRLGGELGVDTPVCRMLFDGIKVLEQKNGGLIDF